MTRKGFISKFLNTAVAEFIEYTGISIFQDKFLHSVTNPMSCYSFGEQEEYPRVLLELVFFNIYKFFWDM